MDLRQVLQAELIKAMKSGDKLTIGVLRQVLGAIARAEAVQLNDRAAVPIEAGNGRHSELTPQEVKLILLDEVDRRRNSIGYYGSAGRHEEAEVLEKEVAILERYLYLTS